MSSTSYRCGRFEVRPAQRLLLIDGIPAVLGARAFDMLVAMLERRDRVLSRDELFALVWPGLVVEENNLRQQVSALRKVMGVEAVVTVPGRGYRFALPVDGDAPPSSRPATVPNNLPLNPAPLIGREAELATVTSLLARTHLLTLSGAGGVGKTCFALEVARSVLEEYEDGVWFVELAPIAKPDLVLRTVASVFVHEETDRPLLQTVLEFLQDRRVLIVLDNCEHVIEACALFSRDVLRCSATTRILATSRESLGIEGEAVWVVPSLGTADADIDLTADQLLAYPATRLFVQRAAAANPAFGLGSQNVAAVAQICRRLDGIPLALELAAARVRSMRVEQVAERLRDRFALLTRGSRTALQRHQTLRSLVDWSHDLLSEPERILLRRLSVFAGGWTLEAAEAVCADDGLVAADVLDVLGRLVEKSLVGLDVQAPEPRYGMLETIRQYGLEKLAAAGEAETLRARHLAHFVELAESVRTAFYGPDTVRCNARIDAELGNLRGALDWSERPAHAPAGWQLINALHRYWYQNLHWREITDRIERLEVHGSDAESQDRARAFYVAAMLVSNFDPPRGHRLGEESLRLSRSLAFAEGIAWSLMWLGYLDSRRRDPATRALFIESLRTAQAIADPWRQAALRVQAEICYAGYEALMGRDEAVEALVRDCERHIAEIGHDFLYTAHCRALLGTLATRRGEYDRASELLAESLALYRRVDSKFDIAGSLGQQGFLELQRGHPAIALKLFRESLPLHRKYPTSPWVTKALAHVVIACAACERWETAARLSGLLAPESSAAGAGAPSELSGRVARAFSDAVLRVRAALGDAAFAAETQAGRRMTREEGIRLALSD